MKKDKLRLFNGVSMEGNGAARHCPVAEYFDPSDAHDVLQKVREMHRTVDEIKDAAKYLHKLDKLEKLDNLDLLVDSIGNNKVTILVGKILGFVIFVLSFIIAFLLTGKALGWFSIHN